MLLLLIALPVEVKKMIKEKIHLKFCFDLNKDHTIVTFYYLLFGLYYT